MSKHTNSSVFISATNLTFVQEGPKSSSHAEETIKNILQHFDGIYCLLRSVRFLCNLMSVQLNVFLYIYIHKYISLILDFQQKNHQKRNTLDCIVSAVCSCDNVGVTVLILLLMCGQTISTTFSRHCSSSVLILWINCSMIYFSFTIFSPRTLAQMIE